MTREQLITVSVVAASRSPDGLWEGDQGELLRRA
jgi:hypothetical protein